MYSKDQISQLRQSFWTAFGQYIAPHLSAEGLRVNWINYKTGIKHLYFKMHTEKKSTFIAIELSHPDAGIRELMFEQFLEFKSLLHNMLGEEWEWQPEVTDENYKVVSRIVKVLPDASIFKQEDWPELISFFKPRMIILDEFWCDAKYSFETFR